MKKIAALLLLIIAFQSCGPTARDAAQYNDSIVKEYNSVILASNELTLAWDKESADMEKARVALKDSAQKAMTNVKKLPPFDGSTALADEAIKCFNVFSALTDNEYKEMVQINSKPLDQFTDSDVSRNNELDQAAKQKIHDAETAFRTMQDSFAVKYKYTLTPQDTTTAKK